jgi:hypothetical protein
VAVKRAAAKARPAVARTVRRGCFIVEEKTYPFVGRRSSWVLQFMA